MLDPKRLRQDPEGIASALAPRGFELDTEAFAALEQQRKELQTETQSLQARRNERSRAIGQAKSRGEDIEPLKSEVADLGDRLKAAEARLAEVQQQLVQKMPALLALEAYRRSWKTSKKWEKQQF